MIIDFTLNNDYLINWPFSYVLATATPKVPAEKDQPVNKTEKKKKKADKSGTMAESGAQIVNA